MRKGSNDDVGWHNGPRKREKIDPTQPVCRCRFCGTRTNRMDGFCSACIREGFDDVYSVTGNDDGWRWREAWAKSHPHAVKYVNPLDGLAAWRERHFYENISSYARAHLCTSKKRK